MFIMAGSGELNRSSLPQLFSGALFPFTEDASILRHTLTHSWGFIPISDVFLEHTVDG